MLGVRANRRSQSLEVTGKGKAGDFFSMMGQRRVTPGWADDTRWNQGRRQQLGRRYIRRQYEGVGRFQ